MGYPPIEELLPKSGYSIYKLVRMASNRAIELADGRPKLIDIPQTEKTPTIALEEIRAGKVVLKEVASQFAPQEHHGQKKAKKIKEEDVGAEVSAG